MALYYGGPNNNGVLDLVRCDSGGTNYRNERYSQYGVMVTNTNVYRSGGASDGATAVTHQITTYTNSLTWWTPYSSWPIAQWNTVTGTNRVVTLCGISFGAAIPNNDEVWMEIEYLGSSGSPIGSRVSTSKANALDTKTALSSDTSAWKAAARVNSHGYSVGAIMQPTGDPNRVYYCTAGGTSASSEPGGYASASDGSSVSDGGCTFQACYRWKLTATLSSPQPAQAGPIDVTPKFAKQSTSYWIDPLITLS